MNVLYTRYFILFFIVTATGFMSIAQEQPSVRNFYPTDYNGENQNWDISQSSEKLIYVANSNGLLEFNGAFWKRYLSPNESIMRSVEVVKDRIYTGCFMEFGYWEKNQSETLEYTSISQFIGVNLIEDEEFWNIISIDEWMVFQSLRRIYIYNTSDESIKFIESDSKITKMFKIEQEVYFHAMGKGVFRINDGKANLLFDDAIFKEDEVVSMFGTRSDLLMLTKSNGFYHTDGQGSIKNFNSTNSVLSDLSIYDAIRLENNNFALGSIANGLLILDSSGKIVTQIDLNQGLLNNTVLALFEDVNNNIWLGLDNGISYVDNNSPFEFHNERKGVLGSVYASAIYEGHLYLGTNQGLFFKEFETEDDFTFIEGTQGQVWSLKVIDEKLFCGHDRGTFLVNRDQLKKISNVQGTWNISPIEGKANLLLQGNYDGLYVLEKSNSVWGLKNKIEGFNNSSRYFEIYKNEIFVNHEYKGVFKLEVDSAYTQIKGFSVDSLLKGADSGIAKYNGNLLFASKKGIFQYNSEVKKFQRDSLLSSAYTPDEYESGKLIVDEKDNVLWVFTKSNILYITPTGLGNKQRIKSIPLVSKVRKGTLGYENISRLGNNKYLIGTTSGYTIINKRDKELDDFLVFLGQVVSGDKKLVNTPQNIKVEGNFKTNQNNFQITYFTPEFNKHVSTQYQFKLGGIYEDWSDWSEDAMAVFENLPHGNYNFEVRSRIGDKISKNIASYSFKIAKPWYISNTLLLLYGAAFVLGIVLIHNLYKRYYKKQRQDLIITNEKELKLARAQNEREIIKLKNDKLQLDFSSKSKELAASLMSIAKKNDLLRTVKFELRNTSLENQDAIKSVVNTINKSLRQDDDWEFFQEAFNNADSEFLKNLKLKHPALTPSDLKLCGYLRLNLSTKEMSNLLNITPRSVEIKRYRLRKKLDLQHEDNLVTYILGL